VTVSTLTNEQRASFETAVSRFQSDLEVDTAAQGYLESRGIGPEAAHGYRLGVVGSRISGLEQYMGRLSVPYLTPAGVVNFTFRCLKDHVCKDEGCPKYLGLEGMDRNLFNVLDLKKPGDTICVAEGELDALTLSMCGLPAVGVPGVENWKKHWAKVLEDFARILVFADGDKAGRKLGGFLAREVRAIPIRMPDGSDVNSLYIERGSDGIHSLIS
jgi:DNA primase